MRLRKLPCKAAQYSVVVLAFLINTFGPIPQVYAQELYLPAPGQMVALSPAFSPAVLKGIKLDPKNPFRFHFFVDRGEANLSQEELKSESAKLIKYFLASLTIPEKDLWVNLSPYEKDRIVPQEFGQTEMGRDLLAEDYLLKQITASLIYPESQLGKEFWAKVYAQAQAKYGTTNIPINTFNKVWIVPEKAVVYENGGVAFVLENHLKVMLEQDYLSLAKHEGIQSVPARAQDANQLGSQIVREIVIPALTKEVNEGKNFSQLRQVFYSLILATWYKKKIKDSILNKVYSNQNKIGGVNVSAQDKDKIYQEYLKAFKKGVYNYIKDTDTPDGATVPRKYFSGGVQAGKIDFALTIVDPKTVNPQELSDFAQTSDQLINVDGNVTVQRKEADRAMESEAGDKIRRVEPHDPGFYGTLFVNLMQKLRDKKIVPGAGEYRDGRLVYVPLKPDGDAQAYMRGPANSAQSELMIIWFTNNHSIAMFGYKNRQGDWLGYGFFSHGGGHDYNIRFQIFKDLRGQGIGKKMFSFLKGILATHEAQRMIFPLLKEDEAKAGSQTRIALEALGFKPGELENALIYEIPKDGAMKAGKRSIDQMNIDRAKIKTLIEGGPISIGQIVERTGIDIQYVRDDIKYLGLAGHPNIIKTIRKPYRNKEQSAADREALKRLLDAGPHTLRELAAATGRDIEQVRDDVKNGKLRGHENLRMEKIVASKEELAERRGKLKDLLSHGMWTPMELAEVTGYDYVDVLNDLNLTGLDKSPNLIFEERRTSQQVLSDRDALLKLLEQGKHTIRDLARSTQRDPADVYQDVFATSDLRNHKNLVMRKVRSHQTVLADREKLKAWLDQDKYTPKELSHLTGEDIVLVVSDLISDPDLRGHKNLIMVKKRTEEEVQQDRRRLKEMLDEGPTTMRQMAEKSGIDITHVRYDVGAVEEFEKHKNLLRGVAGEPRSEEEIADDRMQLMELLNSGKHTIKQLAEATGMNTNVVQYDVASSLYLLTHNNLVLAEVSNPQQIEQGHARLKALLDEDQQTIRQLSQKTAFSRFTVNWYMRKFSDLGEHKNLLRIHTYALEEEGDEAMKADDKTRIKNNKFKDWDYEARREENYSGKLVVVGASAIGFKAFKEIIKRLPVNHPPIILAEHLAPNKDFLTYLETRNYASKIVLCRPGVRYYLSSGLILIGTRISIRIDKNMFPYVEEESLSGELDRLDIDKLFASAAESFKSNVIAIVLSGTGHDGENGVRDVDANGGSVLIQDITRNDKEYFADMSIHAGKVTRHRKISILKMAGVIMTLSTRMPKRLKADEAMNVAKLENKLWELIDFDEGTSVESFKEFDLGRIKEKLSGAEYESWLRKVIKLINRYALEKSEAYSFLMDYTRISVVKINDKSGTYQKIDFNPTLQSNNAKMKSVVLKILTKNDLQLIDDWHLDTTDNDLERRISYYAWSYLDKNRFIIGILSQGQKGPRLEGFICLKDMSEGILMDHLITAPWNRENEAQRQLKGVGAVLVASAISESFRLGYQGRALGEAAPIAQKLFKQLGAKEINIDYLLDVFYSKQGLELIKMQNVRKGNVLVINQLQKASVHGRGALDKTAKINVQKSGGIDFNPAQMSMQVNNGPQDFKFDFNGTEIDAAQITGATFTIRNMTPVTNLPLILGLEKPAKIA